MHLWRFGVEPGRMAIEGFSFRAAAVALLQSRVFGCGLLRFDGPMSDGLLLFAGLLVVLSDACFLPSWSSLLSNVISMFRVCKCLGVPKP